MRRYTFLEDFIIFYDIFIISYDNLDIVIVTTCKIVLLLDRILYKCLFTLCSQSAEAPW